MRPTVEPWATAHAPDTAQERDPNGRGRHQAPPCARQAFRGRTSCFRRPRWPSWPTCTAGSRPRARHRLDRAPRRQARFDAGELPDFRQDTQAIRDGDWRVAAMPAALLDRRVEITGPVEPQDGDQRAQFRREGASWPTSRTRPAPTWANLLDGQRALRKAVAGTLDWMAPDGSKHYQLEQAGMRRADGAAARLAPGRKAPARSTATPMSGSLFDLGLFAFHNADRAGREGPRPVLLPAQAAMPWKKPQLWDEVLAFIEVRLGLPIGR